MRVEPRLAALILGALLSSLVSLGMPLVSVMTVGQLRLTIAASVATVALFASFSIAVTATLVYRRRGLWAVLAAAPALFWPALEASFLVACALNDESCGD
jgi:hypothetical protein